MTQRGETRREAGKQRERHRLQVSEMKSVCRGSELPPHPLYSTTMHIKNGGGRRRMMQMLFLGAGSLSNFRAEGREADANTDEEGDLDIPRRLVKSHLQSAGTN